MNSKREFLFLNDHWLSNLAKSLEALHIKSNKLKKITVIFPQSIFRSKTFGQARIGNLIDIKLNQKKSM